MTRMLLVILIPLIFFISGGVFFAERSSGEDWVWSAILFLIGYQWVFCFILKKNMYTLYIGEPLYIDSEKHVLLRLFHFIIGLIICVSSSLL